MPVFDCEGDSLTPTLFHVLSFQDGKDISSITSEDDMADWLEEQTELIGHNIFLWDLVQFKRLLGVEVKARVIDTLALSWYLYPTRVRHGLESWGEEFGIPKPVVAQDEWKGLTEDEKEVIKFYEKFKGN